MEPEEFISREMGTHVKEAIRRAILTLLVLPDRDKKFLKPTAANWQIVHDAAEAYGWTSARVRFFPTPHDVQIYLDVMGWLSWYGRERDKRDVDLAIAWATGASWERLSRQFAISSSTARRRIDEIAKVILRAFYGKVMELVFGVDKLEASKIAPSLELKESVFKRLKHNGVACLYIFAPPDGRPCKIGHTQSLKRRIDEVRTLNPQNISITFIAWTPSVLVARELERSIHSKCESFRLHGEWFDLRAENAASMAREYIKESGFGPHVREQEISRLICNERGDNSTSMRYVGELVPDDYEPLVQRSSPYWIAPGPKPCADTSIPTVAFDRNDTIKKLERAADKRARRARRRA